ncbi:MAG: MurR/RpiR family transcriptional regulator [bacterium]
MPPRGSAKGEMGKFRPPTDNLNCLLKIQSSYSSLNNSEKKVASYIITNPGDVINQSITEVANKSGVSVTTVARFLNSMNFRGFRQFKITLAQDLASAQPPDYTKEIYVDIRAEDDPPTVIKKVFNASIKFIRDTSKVLDFKSVVKAVDMIEKSQRLHFFGSGGSSATALEGQYRFSQLGIQAIAHTDPFEHLISASWMDENCVAIGISHSGRTKTVVDALKKAKDLGAGTICITNYAQTPITKYADLCLLTSMIEKSMIPIAVASTSPRIVQISVIEVLYVLTALRNPQKYIKHSDKLDEKMEYLRY